jgi:hypothetical protein
MLEDERDRRGRRRRSLRRFAPRGAYLHREQPAGVQQSWKGAARGRQLHQRRPVPCEHTTLGDVRRGSPAILLGGVRGRQAILRWAPASAVPRRRNRPGKRGHHMRQRRTLSSSRSQLARCVSRTSVRSWSIPLLGRRDCSVRRIVLCCPDRVLGRRCLRRRPGSMQSWRWSLCESARRFARGHARGVRRLPCQGIHSFATERVLVEHIVRSRLDVSFRGWNARRAMRR